MNRYWFQPKRYGLGANPSTWEGWAQTLAYAGALLLAAFVTAAPLQSGEPKPLAFVAITVSLTLVFVYICWRKTEGGWRWRWGEDDRR
ncbi:MAG: hypothetical protein R3C25_02885 [Hyphomonadaceae bacterium]